MSEDRAGEPESQRAGERKKAHKKEQEAIPGAARPGSDRRSIQDRSERHSELVSHQATRLDALQANLGHFFKDPYLL